MPQRESIFERKLIQELEHLYPGAFVLKMFPGYIQGFPDRIMIYRNSWAAFEVKRFENAEHQPNQDFYINRLNQMSFASFVYPENKEVFLNEIQRSFGLARSTRLLKR